MKKHEWANRGVMGEGKNEGWEGITRIPDRQGWDE